MSWSVTTVDGHSPITSNLIIPKRKRAIKELYKDKRPTQFHNSRKRIQDSFQPLKSRGLRWEAHSQYFALFPHSIVIVQLVHLYAGPLWLINQEV